LERLAARMPVTLVECGWAANEGIERAFNEARGRLCPNVRSIVLDGRVPEQRRQAWGSADIFCSLADNIQETFGLTPIEAMASGIPSIVSDYDGYRETVRDGIDGFTIPTTASAPGSGADIAMSYALDIDNYDMFIGKAALATAVNTEATAVAMERLATNPELRAKLGATAARQAREVYDWRAIIPAYEALWAELGEIRKAAARQADGSGSRRRWPARLDPFTLFDHYPTDVLTASTRIRLTAPAWTTAFDDRLSLYIAGYAPGFPKLPELRQIRDAIGQHPGSISEIVERSRLGTRMVLRSALILLKFGLAEIDSDAPAETRTGGDNSSIS